MHRARDASKLKSSPEAVRGSRKAEGGKSAGTVDESVTDSVNPFSGGTSYRRSLAETGLNRVSVQQLNAVRDRSALGKAAATLQSPGTIGIAASWSGGQVNSTAAGRESRSHRLPVFRDARPTPRPGHAFARSHSPLRRRRHQVGSAQSRRPSIPSTIVPRRQQHSQPPARARGSSMRRQAAARKLNVPRRSPSQQMRSSASCSRAPGLTKPSPRSPRRCP